MIILKQIGFWFLGIICFIGIVFFYLWHYAFEIPTDRGRWLLEQIKKGYYGD